MLAQRILEQSRHFRSFIIKFVHNILSLKCCHWTFCSVLFLSIEIRALNVVHNESTNSCFSHRISCSSFMWQMNFVIYQYSNAWTRLYEKHRRYSLTAFNLNVMKNISFVAIQIWKYVFNPLDKLCLEFSIGFWFNPKPKCDFLWEIKLIRENVRAICHRDLNMRNFVHTLIFQRNWDSRNKNTDLKVFMENSRYMHVISSCYSFSLEKYLECRTVCFRLRMMKRLEIISYVI